MDKLLLIDRELMAEIVRDELSYATPKHAKIGRIFDAGRRIFGAAAEAMSRSSRSSPKVSPLGPKPAVPASPFSSAKPATPSRPPVNVKPATPSQGSVTPPNSNQTSWQGRVWNGTKWLGGQAVGQGAVLAAPAVYDYMFPRTQPNGPGGNPNDFYSQFSEFYQQNPQMASQMDPRLHSVLTTPAAMRQYYSSQYMKQGEIPVTQSNPDPASDSTSTGDVEFVPEEEVVRAKELLLRDEMNHEMHKFRQQRQKAVMERLKTDPDGAVVIKHMESQGLAVTPESVKSQGQQLMSQYSQAQTAGEVRPFNQWVADMMQPEAQDFAFDAGVARRKMAELPCTRAMRSLSEAVILLRASQRQKQASLLNIFTSPDDAAIGASNSNLASSLVARGGVIKPKAPAVPTANQPKPPAAPTANQSKPTMGQAMADGSFSKSIPSWMRWIMDSSPVGVAIDIMEAGARSTKPPAPAPINQSPAATNVANKPLSQSNLNQRMQRMATSGSLQNAFVKRF